MDSNEVYQRYQELQQYVSWTGDDAARLAKLGPVLGPEFPALIDDFYHMIAQHPEASKVVTGGAAQFQRLKTRMLSWLRELFGGTYDADYVDRRFQAGLRHVDIGLDQA